jgi:hypothetical protein
LVRGYVVRGGALFAGYLSSAAHRLLEAMLRGWGKNRPAEHIPASLALARGKDHNAI